MKRAVTIKDIAEQLNLSRNTVAKALNGQYVPERTRELILNKAREMNYKSLNSEIANPVKKNYRILLVSGKPLNNINYFIPLIRGIENYCYEKNYDLFQYTYNKDKATFSSFSDYVKDLNVDGIVAIECFNNSFVEKIINFGLPVCFNDFTASDITTNKQYDIIGTDDERSICEIVRLLNMKYKVSKFTFVGDNKHCLSFSERYMGMLKGISKIKTTHSRKEDILCNDESFDYGNTNAIKTEILKLQYKPECFICCNDFVARTVCHAMKSLNILIPNDALVVGFDNVSEAVVNSPKITTFSVDKEFLGKETIRILVSRIENPTIPSRTISVSTKLILRDSTQRNNF